MRVACEASETSERRKEICEGDIGVMLVSLWAAGGAFSSPWATFGSIWDHVEVTLGILWDHFVRMKVALGHFGLAFGSL